MDQNNGFDQSNLIKELRLMESKKMYTSAQIENTRPVWNTNTEARITNELILCVVLWVGNDASANPTLGPRSNCSRYFCDPKRPLRPKDSV